MSVNKCFYPCLLDTFKLYYARDGNDSDNKTEVKMTIKNIAWKSDRETKFQNPDNMKDFEVFAKPPNWPVPVYELDTKEPSNNGFENQDFIVWMRTAAFPKFRKLFRKVNHNLGDDFEDGLPKGKYLLHVNYSILYSQQECLQLKTFPQLY